VAEAILDRALSLRGAVAKTRTSRPRPAGRAQQPPRAAKGRRRS
jgi:hypothetical protein